MTMLVDTEDLESTKSEKFLAVVLACFILIGSGWIYYKVDGWVGPQDGKFYTVAEEKVLADRDTATEQFSETQERYSIASDHLNQARDDLSLAVDRGESTTALERDYREAQDQAAEAKKERGADKQVMIEAEAKAAAADKAFDDRAAAALTSPRHWLVAGLRLLLIFGMLFGSLRLAQVLRKRESRYLPTAFAGAASATILAFVFAIDYITDYIDFLELGPIILSAMGIGATIAAFALLQKYLARRVPRARVRRGECPFCAFPVREHQAHCEGCGRDVQAECATCGGDRRVGSPHCSVCGAE